MGAYRYIRDWLVGLKRNVKLWPSLDAVYRSIMSPSTHHSSTIIATSQQTNDGFEEFWGPKVHMWLLTVPSTTNTQSQYLVDIYQVSMASLTSKLQQL